MAITSIGSVDMTGTALVLVRRQRVAAWTGSGIAMIQCRFYDLIGVKATPISSVAKRVSFASGRREKAWLTLSGYRLLSAFPVAAHARECALCSRRRGVSDEAVA
ncbi:MAG: hypothetical protein JNL61_12325 [Rhizobiaceae bacterium]|nr:hypothetical protein [Rhizobiaceae bacterium]